MKKLLILLFSVLMATATFSACDFSGGGGDSTSVTPPTSEVPATKTYTVTFKQNNQLDIVKQVKEGESLTDIPTPVAKIGYDVAWEKVDLTNITENIVVNAEETAKKYMITYNANNGTASVATQEVTYDQEVTLATATRENYDFASWTLTMEGGTAVLSGKWTIAEDVTLVANWQEIAVETCTITFIQNGEVYKTYTVNKGSAFTDTMPTPAAKTGYNVAWETVDLTNVQGNVIINAVETPKEYTVTLNANGGTCAASIKVTYGEEYELPTPTRDGYKFMGWKNGDDPMADKGKWNIDNDNLTLVAQWEIESEQDPTDSEGTWTKNY